MAHQTHFTQGLFSIRVDAGRHRSLYERDESNEEAVRTGRLFASVTTSRTGEEIAVEVLQDSATAS